MNNFPLNLMFCNNCKHVQLEHVVNAKKLYLNYLYMTGISNQFKIHFKNFTYSVLKQFNYFSNPKILEIGSNDCTLLNYFKENNCITVGIEPAKNLFKKTKQNHDIINSFYNNKVNNYLKKKYISFDIIIGNNVFAHIDKIKSTFVLLKQLMHDKSVIILEVSYLLDLINKKLFDTIYHEHLDYHSVISLVPFFNKIGLKIIDIKRTTTHGGSIRLYVVKKTYILPENIKKINQYINYEIKYGLNKKTTFIEFYNKLEKEKMKLKKFFNKLADEAVYGYGAAAKSVTLINYFDLNQDNINLIVDDSKLKQKKYLPGSKIKILNSKILATKPPKYIIILAWNVYEDIMKKLNKYKKIKYIIIPLPKFKLIKL